MTDCVPRSEYHFLCCLQPECPPGLRQAAAHLTENQHSVTLFVQLDQELVQQLELAALLPHLLTVAQQAKATATKLQGQVQHALRRQKPVVKGHHQLRHAPLATGCHLSNDNAN